MARRYIRRVSKVKNDDTKGYIINSTNVVDKEKNTYSANVIDGFNTYSAEEQIVGYWVDGEIKKPIYQKVIKGTLPAPDINGTSWNNIITNASNLIDVSGTIGARPYNNDIVLRNGVYALALDVAISGSTIMYRNLGVAQGSALNLIVKYTKTTS